MRDDPRITGVNQEALLVLATFADRDGTVQTGEARIAQCIGKSDRTVRRAMETAQQVGYLERLTRGHHVPGRTAVASRYRLSFPDPCLPGYSREDMAELAADAVSPPPPPDTGDRLRVVGDPDDDGRRSA